MGWVLLAVGLVGCAGRQIPGGLPSGGDGRALAAVERARAAQGGAAFDQIGVVNVRYEGKWGAIGPKFQPVLVDREFRSDSAETLELPSRALVQRHVGPGGTKVVRRDAEGVSVFYNGEESNDPEVRAAAALVADAYTMFLLGPFYFDRPGVTLAMAGEGRVGEEPCVEVLAVLRPGFGFSDEDRVVLSIARQSGRLLRVRFTLNGLASTAGAEVDVTFSGFREVGGVSWATEFVERIRAPFDLFAHRWRMVGLELEGAAGRAGISAP